MLGSGHVLGMVGSGSHPQSVCVAEQLAWWVVKEYVFDIEADGLLEEVTKVHCIAIEDVLTGERWVYGPDELQQALAKLDEADLLIAHNALGYDLEVLRLLLKWHPKPHQKVRDTLVIARLAYADRERDDYNEEDEDLNELNGAHSLEAWGVRLGCPKIDYQGDFKAYTPEMREYVLGDVKVCAVLFRHLQSLKLPEEAVVLEHRFAAEAERLSRRGITMDLGSVEALCRAMDAEVQRAQTTIQSMIPASVEEMKTPEYWVVRWPNGSYTPYETKGEADNERKALGVKPRDWRIERGPTARRYHPFNCNSRPQIRKHLWDKYQWKSPKLTDKGEELLKAGHDFDSLAQDYGSVGEDVLRGLPYPEAEPLADFLMVQKRLGQVRDGEKAWLKLVKPDGKIHHRLIHIRANTMRCGHSGPNMSQVPAVAVSKETGEPLMGMEGKFGYECRACFVAEEGYVLVGADMSGIEARMLAHFLFPYDGGAYRNLVLGGDVHTINVQSLARIAGFTVKRQDAKTTLYALLYGVGALKQGRFMVECCPEAHTEWRSREAYYLKNPKAIKRFHYVGGGKLPYRPVEAAYADVGQKTIDALEHGIGGYSDLKEETKKEAKSGKIWVLDRHIPVRSSHSAINTRFQGGGAIIMKRWTVETMHEVRRRRIDAHLLINAHDENQVETRPCHVEDYSEICLRHIVKAGEHYNLNIPLAGEVKAGKNWAETH